jgi:3'-5' exonuclease
MGINYNHHTSTGVLDLHDLWRTVAMIENFRFPYKDTSGHQDLSTLVQLCLGKRLDKSNQLSNWTLRPLRRDQIYYAALDAYCLLEIYGVIEAELYKLNINFNQLLNDLLMNRRHRSGGASAAGGSGSSGRWKDKQQNNRRSGGDRNDDYRDNYGRSQTAPEGPHRRPVK